MSNKQRAQELKLRIEDFLHMEKLTNFKGVTIKACVTYDNKVMIRVNSEAYQCGPCQNKGLFASTIDRIKFTWCDACHKKWATDWENTINAMKKLTPVVRRDFMITSEGRCFLVVA